MPRQKDHNVIDTKWLFKIKRNPDGSINKCKARYLMREFTQVPGIDFDEMYSPTVLYQVLRVIIVIACLLGLQLHQMDMKTAFLNGIIDKELYIEQPDKFEEHGKLRKDFVCQLNRALYRL